MKIPNAPKSKLGRAQVLLLATFHFANPARDKVKIRMKDVMAPESQSFLAELALRISNFKPTVILLEYDPNDDDAIQARYARFKTGEAQLTENEIEQVGFRIAKLCSLARVESFDERNTPWRAQELFEQLQKEPELEQRFNQKIQEMTEAEDRSHSSMTLKELLTHYNSSEFDRLNKSLYILTNAAGVGENFAGADASASWWHRNFRMFARIQKFAQPGERLLVIGGQGHIAVIRDLVHLDENLISEPVAPYL